MSHFTVTATWVVEAEDRKEAAMKAAALAYELTPNEFSVKDAAAIAEDVELTDDEMEEALRLNREGKMFPGIEEHKRKHLG